MAFETIQNEVVLELENQRDVLHLPIKRSERIKYTCFAVSKNFLIFGATSGGLYAFKRNPYSFWQLIPSKESAIVSLSISPFENFIAFATNKNIICILEVNEQMNCKLVIRTDDLADAEITAFCWTEDFHKPILYIGDGCGRVSSLKLSFLNKSILHLPTTLSMTLDSRVVQLCWHKDYLLVSTMTRSFLCDTAKEQFKQIGQQLRDGYYGATFLCKDSNARVFCARPGSRLWEVDLNSVVHSTHQFKGPLAIPPTPFISLFNASKIVETKSTDVVWSPQSFNFVKLYSLHGSYIVTFKKDALYILNVNAVSVLFWNNCFGEIVDVQCSSNSIFVWNSDGDVHELILLPINKCLLTLYLKQLYDLCAIVISRLYQKLISLQPKYLAELSPLCDLPCLQLGEEDEKLVEKLKDEIRACASKDVELESGIHVVNNRHFTSALLDDTDVEINRSSRSFSRSDSDEIRRRSYSLPSNLKKDEIVHSNHMNGFDCKDSVSEHNMPNDNHKFLDTDDLYLEIGLYNSPFFTKASYEILEECITDLSSSVSEKFNESSKSLKQKWKTVESKLKFLKNKKTVVRLNNTVHETNTNNHGAPERDIVTFGKEDCEPVVQPRRRKSTEVEIDYDKIIELCDSRSSNMFELLNVVVNEYEALRRKHGINKYEQFPFSIPEKSLVNAKKLFKEFLRKDSLLQWFGHESFPIREDVNFSELYPPLLLEVFSEEDLKLDFLLCKTLIIFTEIMNAPTILETIKSLNFPCHYMSFCYIMKYFQMSEILERNNYAKGNSSQWPLPVYLNTMLLMISLDQVDVFCEMGLKKNVDAMDVMYMMFHLELRENDVGILEKENKYRKVCLAYLQKQYEFHESVGNENAYAVSLALKILVAVEEEFDVCCRACWFLLPGTSSSKTQFVELTKHLLEYLWNVFQSACSKTNPISRDLLLVLKRSMSNNVPGTETYSNVCYKNDESCEHMMCARLVEQIENPSELVLLSFNVLCTYCYRIPNSWQYLCDLHHSSPFKILHSEHFVQLGNLTALEATLPRITIEEARTVFTLKTRLSNGFCLNCGNKTVIEGETMSYNDLTLFVLRHLGAKSCLQVLEASSGTFKLEESFYRSIVLSAIPGVNSDLVDPIVATVSSQHNVIPLSKKVAEELDNALKLDLPDRNITFKKSDAHHWGLTINLEEGNQAICYCCSLPLFSKYLIKEDNGGIMLFSCNHTYHTVCLKNKDCTATCLVCDRFLR